MKTITKKITMADVKAANEMYFSKGNKRFFGDVSYSVIHIKKLPYLLTYSAGWTDMFTNQKTYFYTVKPIDKDTLKIGQSIERNGNSRFMDKDILKDYIKDYINTGN